MKQASLCAAILSLSACAPSQDGGSANQAAAEGADVASGSTSTRPSLPVANPDKDPQPAPVNNSGGAPELNEADDSGSEESAPSAVIPERYRGRWGMVPADCEPGRSDSKGLLTIGRGTLRFYESVGALQEQRPAIATSFAGIYSFTGEGQSWERGVVLTREGNRLIRTENGRSYTYTRC